jgi:two-component system NtrC family sensor kinase
MEIPRFIQLACQLLECEACALILLEDIGLNGDQQVTASGSTHDASGMVVRKILTSKRQVSEGAPPASRDSLLDQSALSQELEWIYQANQRGQAGLLQQCLDFQSILNIPAGAADPLFDLQNDGWPAGADIENHRAEIEIQNMLCAPLLSGRKSLGVLQAVNKRPTEPGLKAVFDGRDEQIIAVFASALAHHFEHSRLSQELVIAKADLQATQWEKSEAQNSWEALFRNIPDAAYVIDQEYLITAINQNRARRVNQSPEELLGRICYQALYQQSQPCPYCQVQDTLTRGKYIQRSEQRFGDPANQRFLEMLPSYAAGEPGDGQHHWSEDSFEWEIHSIPVLDPDGNPIKALLFERDITEKRQLEDILTQSAKLAALGQLAAGIAHEINNPLTAILANAQLLQRSLPPENDLQESVDLISRAGGRAVQVVRNLLDFARKEEYHLSLTNVNETIKRAFELIHHEMLARGVMADFKPEPDLPMILASQDHLQTVWLNLLLNAIDSIDRTPGKITVTTQRVGDELVIVIADNGKGIPAGRLTRIFDPFYTTKAPGRGTGLGLSVSHRIIKQHGGFIRVESQVGAGSTFTVILPLS